MTEHDIAIFLGRAADGQIIKVTLASGRVFEGIYNSEDTTPEAGLYFETMDGKALRADWVNVSNIDYRSPRMAGGRMFIPDGHPLSNKRPAGVRADGVPLRPHTTRNR